MKYELVVVWTSDGERQIFEYNTEEEAERGMANYYRAFGNQCWCCVRPKL